jgi:hypothetical protein
MLSLAVGHKLHYYVFLSCHFQTKTRLLRMNLITHIWNIQMATSMYAVLCSLTVILALFTHFISFLITVLGECLPQS